MRRLPSIAIMFGLPSPLAHDDEPRDEDNLEGNDDAPTNTLDLLYERMKHGDEHAAHAAKGIARCLQEMAHAAGGGNTRALQHYYEQCCELIDDVDGEESHQ